MKKDALIIQCLNIGPYQVNTYIVACAQTLEGFIIDPGGEEDRIIAAIKHHNIIPKYIFNTHGHKDHVPANASLSDHYAIPICMHKKDKLFFQKRSVFQGPDIRKNYAVDLELHGNDVLMIGNHEITVLHTPGHTPGSVCYYTNNCLFSGDTLFVGNAGRTDLDGGNLETLIHSIKTKLLPLPPQTILYPGHDYGPTPISTLERERRENIYITDFILSSD